MATIFKYNNQFIQCKDLNKKLRKMKIDADCIEIIKDDIPFEILEKTFVELTNGIKIEDEEEDKIGIPFFYYDPITKHTTGVGYSENPGKEIPAEWAKDWIKIIGIPKYPLEIENNLPKVL